MKSRTKTSATSIRPARNPSRQRRRQLYHTLILLGIGLFFTLLTALFHPFQGAQLWLSDRLFTSEPPSPNIVIAGIDDATLQTFGKWSNWSRRWHAQAIDHLKDASARVIGFDILFADNSPDDADLAAAISRAGTVVLASVATDIALHRGKIIYQDTLLPVAPLLNACQAIGHANITPDADGRVRRLPLIIEDATGRQHPSFGLSILQTLFAMPLPAEYRISHGKLNLFARDIPVDHHYRLIINFSAEDAERPYISYGDIITGDFDPAMVRNKIVLIGMTATGDIDAWQIPTSAGKIPGIYIHAASIDTILRGRFLTEPPSPLIPLVMLALLAITSFALPRLKLQWGGGLIFFLLVLCVASSFIAFDYGYLVSMLYPLLLLSIIYLGSIITTIAFAQADRRFVTNLFGRYVSPQVAESILRLADAGQLRLGGERRTVTVFFADIRQYTRLSERISPEDIVEMLNTYLSIIIDRVLKYEGMVNKFAGDNIMAVWNAPQDQDYHALLAVRAAWESQVAISEKQAESPDLPKVQFGIGINTGEALAGNVGSVGRTEYTVIGDTVNLASRICSVTPGGEVWLGPETYRLTSQYIHAEALEPRELKGKTEAVILYRMTGWKTDR